MYNTCEVLYKEYKNSNTGSKQYCCKNADLCNSNGIDNMDTRDCYDNRSYKNQTGEVVTCMPRNRCAVII